MEIKATAMATEIAAHNTITRAAAFDMILATAVDLGIKGTRFTAKQAAEIETIVAASIALGTTITLTRSTI